MDDIIPKTLKMYIFNLREKCQVIVNIKESIDWNKSNFDFFTLKLNISNYLKLLKLNTKI